ncbi:response regulator transcription factor [Prevotella sp. PMUR]|uniref:Response regulator transcription factor n=2 Tax=Xylanibacter muris TaxID=2736290 RepID=A0ABX2ALN3_9BACT|nr:response regulator transcription factor [Xylanibacter muris]
MKLLRNGVNREQFMMKQEHELKSLLTKQQFETSDNKELLLAQARACANGYALATEGIAVVSDFQNNECHIYSGKFGQTIMNLPKYMVDSNSAFEDIVFSHAKENELIERHVLELRFFNFIKELSIKEKTEFSASCILSFYRTGGNDKVKILHTTRYLSCSANGSVLLGLCTYIPYPVSHNRQDGIIVNLLTGETVGRDIYEANDRKILSQRQLEILSLLAKGMPSKQIADNLNISIYTVNRHRQDILAALKVANTAAAVEIALRMNLI